jgi:hypothetical protein
MEFNIFTICYLLWYIIIPVLAIIFLYILKKIWHESLVRESLNYITISKIIWYILAGVFSSIILIFISILGATMLLLNLLEFLNFSIGDIMKICHKKHKK